MRLLKEIIAGLDSRLSCDPLSIHLAVRLQARALDCTVRCLLVNTGWPVLSLNRHFTESRSPGVRYARASYLLKPIPP